MFSKKLVTLLVCGSLLGSTVLTGCSNASSAAIQIVDTTVTGTVQAVNGDVVTVVISGMGDSSAQTQSQVSATLTSKSGLANSAAADSEVVNYEEADRDIPKVGDESDVQGFEESDGSKNNVGEDIDYQEADVKFGKSGDLTIQIVISGNVKLTNSKGEAITFADIKVGDMITITIDEDGNVTSAIVGAALNAKTTADPAGSDEE